MVPYKTEEDIRAMVERVAAEIVRDYGEQELVLVILLKGAVCFGVDLMRALERRRKERRLYIEFMRVSSYEDSRTSIGNVKIDMDVQHSVAGRQVLIVDDIADTRQTLGEVRAHLLHKEPISLRICVAADKISECRRYDVQLDYVGFSDVEGFLVGYGLDDQGTCRGLEVIERRL